MIVRLQNNIGKTKAVLCTPGFIWGQLIVKEYKRRATGEEATFREQKKTRVSCEECRIEMTALSLRDHMERSHGIVMLQTQEVDVGGGVPEIYAVPFSQVLKSMACPVGG